MKKYLFVTIAAGLAFVLAGLLIWQSRQITLLENTVKEIHLSALHQTAEDAQALSLTMEKALLATSPAHALTLLHQASRTAGSLQQHLALLDLSPGALQPMQIFANRLCDEVADLLPLLAGQEQIDSAHRDRLNRQLVLCSQLSSQLALADTAADLEGLQLDLTAAAAAAPPPRGLPRGEITQEEAMDIARQFVGTQRVTGLKAAPGTTGSLPAYGVTVQTDDLQLNLEITRQGGKVLWMMPETASFPLRQSIDACREAALAFLELQGFSPVEPVHHQIYDGLCVISMVPLQEDVLLYPDLIRIQVRMDTAMIVGLEAHNYWQNHTLRQLPSPALSADELAVPGLQSSRLCLLPHAGSEVLCHELTVVHDGETFLVYIDAGSGQEIELMKTIPVENGSLTA